MTSLHSTSSPQGSRARLETSIGVLATVGLVFVAAVPMSRLRAHADVVGVKRDDATPAVDFNRDIRPILSDKCYTCHGPDGASREAGLRLDLAEAALALNNAGEAAIVPGDVEHSLLYERVSAESIHDRMPPADSGKALTPEEIDLLRRWIIEGAEYQQHWSFVAPTKPDLPSVSDPLWVRNPIDAFTLNRLDENGLQPSSKAEKVRVLRRVTLDLTGLPPTIEEIDAFLSDESENAYERVVDRLLQSPRYGEHMARYWLDAARYGDTHGLHLDNYREMWRWREWVINAFNANKPFDEFTIEQLAGDLIPDATAEQLIATGFNRNNVTTSEGGAIPEEYLVKYAVDRVETTSTVWMGLTTGCASCHDHKFDPITQKEFYELFAFFNNIAEEGMDGNKKDPPPVVRAPTDDQRKQIAEFEAQIASIEARINAPDPAIDQAQREWENGNRADVLTWWQVLAPTQFVSTAGSTLKLLADSSVLATGANPAKDDYLVVGTTDLENIQLVQLEALTHESLPHTGPGRADNANFVLSEIELVAVSRQDPSQSQPITFRLALADFSQENGEYFASKAIDGVLDDNSGWAVAGYDKHEDRTAVFIADEPFGYPGGTELRLQLKHQTGFEQHGIGRFRISLSNSNDLARRLDETSTTDWFEAGPFQADERSQKSATTTAFEPETNLNAIDLTASFGDGAIKWIEKPEYINAEIHDLSEAEFAATYLYRTIESPNQRTVTLSIGSDDACVLWVNGSRVFEQSAPRAAAADQNRVAVELNPGTNHVLFKIVNYAGGYAFYFNILEEDSRYQNVHTLQALALDSDARTPAQSEALRTLFRKQHSPEMRALYDDLDEQRAALAEFESTIPTTLVMQEREDRRMANVLNRGNYDQPKEEVTPNVPACLPPLPGDAPADRLGLARWLTASDHPLTARVTVNRLWQQLFGRGLVETSEDFGSQGAAPTHPELLDWLAVEFMESGWDTQHLLRLMVTSATYRQSSRISPDRLQADPHNIWYSRAPRFRMDAEMIRDFALATSGLLVERLGGPSVKPYQPDGLWEAVAYPDSDTQAFEKDEGEAQYRRSLYTFWKRTQPPPNLATFDAPTRETCAVRRPRTNTPLQMLVLMNDPQFVEASRAFAERIMLEAGRDDTTDVDERIHWAFRLATGRNPVAEEIEALHDVFVEQREMFAQSPEQADALLSVGDYMPDEGLDQIDLAAWTSVANILLSLDESITKG